MAIRRNIGGKYVEVREKNTSKGHKGTIMGNWSSNKTTESSSKPKATSKTKPKIKTKVISKAKSKTKVVKKKSTAKKIPIKKKKKTGIINKIKKIFK